MKKIYFFIPAFLLCIAQLAAGLLILKDTKTEALDPVAVNAAVQSAAGQWEGLLSGQNFVLPDGFGGMDYAVLTKEGTAVGSSREGIYKDIYTSVKNRDTMLDIVVDGNPVGKFIIFNDVKEQGRQGRERLLFLLCVFTAAEVLVLTGTVWYFGRRLLMPFSRLKAFAVRVAGGDLDFPLVMDKKNVFGAFTESFDLMREELKKARADEMAAVQSKKELVAKLSHDIKTPVASIQAVSELMSLTAGTEKEIKQLAVITDKARQIDRLISNLFHATLEELKELPVNPSVHSSRVIGKLIQDADYLGLAKMESVPDCLVCFDEMRLQQVFDNILSNSYKYAKEEIRVTFRLEEDALCIEMEDRGPGVGEDELPLLTEKYYRGKNAEGKNGAGLGLYISAWLLVQMGGNISCGNTDGGFCVRVCLKLA